MQTLSATSQLADLANHEQPGSISILMPTHQSGRQVEQNAIRFKNLLREVTQQLVDQGEAEGDVERRLQPLYQRARDDNFWQHQSVGLALYVAGDQEIAVALHHAPEPMAYVGDHFLVTPAAIDAANRQDYYVLAVSWNNANLYRASRTQMDPVESDQFPVSLRDVKLPPDAEEHLQFHTQRGGQGDVHYHGQGEGEDMLEADRLYFLSQVGKRVEDLLGAQFDRLVVVSTDEVAGHLASVTHLNPAELIHGSPDGWKESELRERVLEQMKSLGDDPQKQLQEELGTALAQNKATKGLEDTLQAAASGRVAKLIVNGEHKQWGNWDNASQSFQATEKGQGVELINLAILKTLQNGGDVVQGNSDLLDASTPVAALLRY